jgi:hypothetical protein
MEIRAAKQMILTIPRLPELIKRVKALEKALAKSLDGGPEGERSAD